jgi:hypothetical protein
MATATPNRPTLLSSPARNAKARAVETASGCAASNAIINTIVTTNADADNPDVLLYLNPRLPTSIPTTRLFQRPDSRAFCRPR